MDLLNDLHAFLHAVNSPLVWIMEENGLLSNGALQPGIIHPTPVLFVIKYGCNKISKDSRSV